MFIWDFVANPVMESILDWFYSQMVGFLGAFFAQMGNMGVDLFDLSWVRSVVRFFSQLGWALFAVSVVVSAFECGIEYASGRGNLQQPALNALKGFFAVSLFTTVPVRLYALSVSLQGTFAMEITGAGKSIGELGNEILTGLEGAGLTDIAAQVKWGLGTNPIMLLFAMIFMAYAVIKVFFSNLKRGGILLIQIAVGSLYMFPSPGAIRTASPSGASRSSACASPPSSRPPFWWRGSWCSATKPSWALASCWPPERCPASPGPSAWTPPPEPIS